MPLRLQCVALAAGWGTPCDDITQIALRALPEAARVVLMYILAKGTLPQQPGAE